MTRIVVVGDSRVGKTEFMHLATTGRVPLNIYTSIAPEHFQLRGTCTTADFIVVPGNASRHMLRGACEGSDGIMVIYHGSVRAAARWILRCTQGGRTTVPILMCHHNTQGPADRRVPDTLRDWPTAEHTCTSTRHVTGMADCANRVVRRARAEQGSPLTV